VALNGAGILPEFQGRGGNALLYSEKASSKSLAVRNRAYKRH